MNELATVLQVDGFAMQREADGAFRIRDIDLADRLGYDEPRAIRKLIARMIERGLIPHVLARDTVSRIEKNKGFVRGAEERVVTEYWLDRIEAREFTWRTALSVRAECKGVQYV